MPQSLSAALHPRHGVRCHARLGDAAHVVSGQPPAVEPGFALVREEREGRSIRYTIRSYAADKPEGERY
jgi:hypothetical protein